MAAGPTLWDALEARLGPYAPFAAEVEGETSGQGLRLELVKAVSDGYTARVYYTLTDEAGDRLNGHTQVSGGLKGARAAMGRSTGNQVVSYDSESRTLLLEASAEGLDTSQAVTLELTGVDPGERYIQDARFQPQAEARALDTDSTGGGRGALPGQTPRPAPTPRISPSAPWALTARGASTSAWPWPRALTRAGCWQCPMTRRGSRWAPRWSVQRWTAAWTTSSAALRRTTWRTWPPSGSTGLPRPRGGHRGEWSLPVELEPAEQRVIPVGRTLEDGFYVERIEVSGMNIAVYYRGGDKSWFVVWATDKNGVRTGVPMGMMSAGAEDGLNLGLWSFETPAALDELASVTLLGETFPLE